MALPRNLYRWAGWLTLSVASGLLAVAGMAMVVETRQIADTRQPLFDNLAAVCGPHALGQSFVATAPNLDRIDLWLAWSSTPQTVKGVPTAPATSANSSHSSQVRRYHLFLPVIVRSLSAPNTQGCNLNPGDGNGVIAVSLKATPASSTVIASATLRLDEVENLATSLRRPYVYQSFAFPPIPDSAGRTFYLSVEAPTTSVAAPLLARYHHGDVYTQGTRYLDGTPVPGDLAFRIHYGATLVSDLELLLNRLAYGRPAPFNWPWLYPLLLVVYVGSFVLVVRFIVQSVAPCED